MKHCYVKIVRWDPYEKSTEHTVGAGNPGLAAKRAFEQARKESLRGVVVKEIAFKVRLI